MRRILYSAALLALPSGALAQSFDPDEYLRETYGQKSEIEVANTIVTMTHETLDGIPYVKFQIGEHALLVEKMGFRYMEKPPQEALINCAISSESSEKQNPTEDHTTTWHRVRLETPIYNNWKIDLTLANQVTYSVCGGGYVAFKPDMTPIELGVSYTTTERRQTKIYRLFLALFPPTLGFIHRF